MYYLGLTHQQLSCFSHHWFWGLRADSEYDENLYVDALYLQQNPELLRSMENEVANINQMNWLLRSCYWLFNINQYRYHYYQLQGYWSLQLYNQVQTMLLEKLLVNVGSVEGATYFVFAVAGAVAVKYLTTPTMQALAWFSGQIYPAIPPQDVRVILPETIEPRAVHNNAVVVASSNDGVLQQTNIHSNEVGSSMNIIIRAEMLDELRILRLDLRLGATVPLSVLKEAYKTECLRTHPDKTGNLSDTEFKMVSQAYSKLLHLIEQDISPRANSGLSFFGGLDEINRRLDILKKEQALAQSEMSQLQEEKRNLAEGVSQLHDKGLEQKKELDKLSAELASLFELESAKNTEFNGGANQVEQQTPRT